MREPRPDQILETLEAPLVIAHQAGLVNRGQDNVSAQAVRPQQATEALRMPIDSMPLPRISSVDSWACRPMKGLATLAHVPAQVSCRRTVAISM